MARPTKLDDITAQRIVNAVAEGNTRAASAAAAGINPDTLYTWLRRGREGEAGYAEFAERVKRAEGEAELAMVKVVRTAAQNTWQAAAWWLERKKQKTWAIRRGPVQETANASAPVTSTDKEAAQRKLRSLMAAMGED